MSVESIALVLNHSRASGTAKLVLVGIANHDGDGGAFPSHATLARYANVSERNVRRAITRLVDLGEVRIEVQAGGLADWEDHRRPNRYSVLVACPPWCDRSRQHRDTRKRSTKPEPLVQGGALPPPGQGEGGALPPPGGEGATAPLTVPSEPTSQEQEPQVQDTRARCGVCSQDEYRCQRLQISWVPEDRHAYTPAPRAGQAQQETEGVQA